jgi:hypothetical protein
MFVRQRFATRAPKKLSPAVPARKMRQSNVAQLDDGKRKSGGELLQAAGIQAVAVLGG